MPRQPSTAEQSDQASPRFRGSKRSSTHSLSSSDTTPERKKDSTYRPNTKRQKTAAPSVWYPDERRTSDRLRLRRDRSPSSHDHSAPADYDNGGISDSDDDDLLSLSTRAVVGRDLVSPAEINERRLTAQRAASSAAAGPDGRPVLDYILSCGSTIPRGAQAGRNASINHTHPDPTGTQQGEPPATSQRPAGVSAPAPVLILDDLDQFLYARFSRSDPTTAPDEAGRPATSTVSFAPCPPPDCARLLSVTPPPEVTSCSGVEKGRGAAVSPVPIPSDQVNSIYRQLQAAGSSIQATTQDRTRLDIALGTISLGNPQAPSGAPIDDTSLDTPSTIGLELDSPCKAALDLMAHIRWLTAIAVWTAESHDDIVDNSQIPAIVGLLCLRHHRPRDPAATPSEDRVSPAEGNKGTQHGTKPAAALAETIAAAAPKKPRSIRLITHGVNRPSPLRNEM